VRDNAAGVRMVLVPAGEFTMGSPADEPERDAEETAHRCVIGQGFWLGETEVTQQQWQRAMGNNPSKHRGEQNPVDSVSWEDCQKLAAKLNGAAGAGWRLPSEAEWEYACRAGTTTPFAFGASIDAAQVNFDGSRPYARGEKSENRGQVLPVKSLPANAFGLHEMHGNVHEWCQDAWAPYAASGTQAPVTGNGNPVVRGGAWGSMASGCRSAFRFKGYERYAKNERLGLRLARSLDPQ
jgi:formylglycine-generating enzyme required for sulfatase activity